MTTALATEHVEDDPDRVISATVRALVSAHQVDTGRLAAALQMSRNSYYNRINGEKPWHAKDVARAARFFAVPVQDIYSGTVNVGFRSSAPMTTYSHRSHLRIVDNSQVTASDRDEMDVAQMQSPGPSTDSELSLKAS